MASWDLTISKELSMVADVLRESVNSQEDRLTEIANYVIGAGGKRIRPTVTILTFYALGGREVERAVKIAAALELIHTATLLHDDINDGGEMRRGKLAAYRKYGTQNAIVAGDFLFTQAFAIGGKFEPAIVDITAEACSRLAEGEIRQQMRSKDVDLTEEGYIDIIKRKTAWPIAAGARVGAILAGGSPEEVMAAGEYGTELGVAFQIVDDILDVVGNQDVLGKPIGTDVREGNITLLTMNALRNGTSQDQKELSRIIRKTGNTPQEILGALEIIVRSGAVEVAQKKAAEFGERAKARLGPLPQGPYKLELLRLVDLVLQRES